MKTPEELAIEWLREEYGDTSNWTYMGQEMSLDAFHAGYQAAKDQFADSSKVMPQWISVKDRLPEIGERGYSDDVLMLSEHGMEVTHIEKRKRIVEWKGLKEVIETNNGTPIEDFTHWMPLPKPPEDEK
jgi:hypothetical protein